MKKIFTIFSVLAFLPSLAVASHSVKWNCKGKESLIIVGPTNTRLNGEAFATTDADVYINKNGYLTYAYVGENDQGEIYQLVIDNVSQTYVSVVHEHLGPEVGKAKLFTSKNQSVEENLSCYRF